MKKGKKEIKKRGKKTKQYKNFSNSKTMILSNRNIRYHSLKGVLYRRRNLIWMHQHINTRFPGAWKLLARKKKKTNKQTKQKKKTEPNIGEGGLNVLKEKKYPLARLGEIAN